MIRSEKAELPELRFSILNYDKLTNREKEILPYILYGKSNLEISIIIGISKRTIEKHVASVIEKAEVENRKVLIAEANSHKLSFHK